MNLNTVKASLFRSRNKLKALLEKEEFFYENNRRGYFQGFGKC